MNRESKLTNDDKVEVWTQTDGVYSLNLRKYLFKLKTFLQRWQQGDDLEMNLRAHNAEIAKPMCILRYLGV